MFDFGSIMGSGTVFASGTALANEYISSRSPAG
jgi:hypothetical protein